MSDTPTKQYSRINYPDKLAEFYPQEELPEYILDAGKSFIKIRVSDWQGDQDLIVTVEDVIEYYRYEAGNITSGCRIIAGYAGDWRPIDILSKECLEWFKFVNIEGLRQEGRKYGLIPKF